MVLSGLTTHLKVPQNPFPSNRSYHLALLHRQQFMYHRRVLCHQLSPIYKPPWLIHHLPPYWNHQRWTKPQAHLSALSQVHRCEGFQFLRFRTHQPLPPGDPHAHANDPLGKALETMICLQDNPCYKYYLMTYSPVFDGIV